MRLKQAPTPSTWCSSTHAPFHQEPRDACRLLEPRGWLNPPGSLSPGEPRPRPARKRRGCAGKMRQHYVRSGSGARDEPTTSAKAGIHRRRLPRRNPTRRLAGDIARPAELDVSAGHSTTPLGTPGSHRRSGPRLWRRQTIIAGTASAAGACRAGNWLVVADQWAPPLNRGPAAGALLFDLHGGEAGAGTSAT